jgi:hypothetical protein
MPMMFNSLLRESEIPLGSVRLLRHKDQRAAKGRTPYELWRDTPSQFDLYQSHQTIQSREKLKAPYWASFLGTPNDETVFVGIYSVKYLGLLKHDLPKPHMDGVDKAGTCDAYELTQDKRWADLTGRLYVEWGTGKRSWIQRADRRDKQITELRTQFKEPDFPGFLNFIQPLSRLSKLPKDWVTTLQSSRGVYLLTCPKTKEQYVGSAYGSDGFWHRWQEYLHTGHGGNIALKSRDPSDYHVSILEVAGTAATNDDIIEMEKKWKDKLQSRKMGLNRN